MRSAALVALLLLSSLAEARGRACGTLRRSCATAGMSASPGPCCKGLAPDGIGICRNPADEWTRNINEPGPDDTPAIRKQRAQLKQAKK
jgi:hypothetical protein